MLCFVSMYVCMDGWMDGMGWDGMARNGMVWYAWYGMDGMHGMQGNAM